MRSPAWLNECRNQGEHGELRDNALQKVDGNGKRGQRVAALLPRA